VRKYLLATAMALPFLAASEAAALSLKDAILYVLETNPDIKAAEANKQAIEFELEQARNLRAPRVQLEAWAGASVNRGNATPDLSSAQDWIEGYEVSATISQMLFDGYRTRSEIERQAYRIDAAAWRVLERSEVLSLEAVRLYTEVIRTGRLLALAQENQAYHQKVFNRIQGGFDSGVVGAADVDQAEERLYLAKDTALEFQYDHEDMKTLFLATVGVEAKNLGTVPDIGGSVPGSMEKAIATARQRNPTLRFAQNDVGSAEALSRRVNANQYPSLHLEAQGRVGEDVGGFTGERSDAKIGLIMRYEFQGGRKRAERQEQVRRVNESRAHLLAQSREVEREVRQSWITLESARRRLQTINAQAQLSRRLRGTYEKEFEVGTRSLLDVLNTQNALFQSEANLINARAVEIFVEYRVLASAGVLLATLGIEPPEDAKPYAREAVNAPGVGRLSDETQFDAGTFSKWRKSLK